MDQWDLVVIGSGPAGQRAAIQAAKLGKRVAIIERRHMVGGVCVNTGTVPSKTLREAVLYLTGMRERSLYGSSYRVKDDLKISDLFWRTQHVIDREVHVIRDQLRRNHVQMYAGDASFIDSNTIGVHLDEEDRHLETDKVIVAVGTVPARPKDVAFDERTILDSDGILHLQSIPATLVVVGAGVIGIEYASMFAALGTKVTVIERRSRLLEFCDAQMVEALQFHLRELGVTFRFSEAVMRVEERDGGAVTELASGKRVPSEAVFYAAGRQGATSGLNLQAAGLEPDPRGRITTSATYQTSVPNIYAVGDVIGFPALAATSMEQGRLAALCAFDVECRPMGETLPIGIYTIPELSFVGHTEEELTEKQIPYEIGVSRWRELARGQILGDADGLLKLLVSPDDRTILGVHVFGTGATELVHIGQAVMQLGGGIDYLIDAVFNYPTLAESYKVAALDAANRLNALVRLGG